MRWFWDWVYGLSDFQFRLLMAFMYIVVIPGATLAGVLLGLWQRGALK